MTLFLRSKCPHLLHDPHPERDGMCVGGQRFRVDEDAAVRLVSGGLPGVDSVTVAVLVRDLIPTLLVKENT